jgi:hypothetical protein
MFAISQQINAVAQRVNAISVEIMDLKSKVNNGFAGATGAASTQPTVSSTDIERAVETASSDLNQKIGDLKRVVDSLKADTSKDTVLLEASLSRKIESNVQKMLSDKIKVALESQVKALVADEVAAAMTSSSSSPADETEKNDAADFEISFGGAAGANTPVAAASKAKRPARKTPAGAGKDA